MAAANRVATILHTGRSPSRVHASAPTLPWSLTGERASIVLAHTPEPNSKELPPFVV